MKSTFEKLIEKLSPVQVYEVQSLEFGRCVRLEHGFTSVCGGTLDQTAQALAEKLGIVLGEPASFHVQAKAGSEEPA